MKIINSSFEPFIPLNPQHLSPLPSSHLVIPRHPTNTPQTGTRNPPPNPRADSSHHASRNPLTPRPPPNIRDNALHPLRQDPDDRHLRRADAGRREGVLRLPAGHPQLPLLRPQPRGQYRGGLLHDAECVRGVQGDLRLGSGCVLE
ncbi:uncharacterized protein BO95DRAFT_484639 [Aspergillus brunneoviolaceus CBS 621.78]|uniref:Uncharacterized protein n=1 Tax=Aspergillus brunneoviolaceus CBS 621.78 TaxID=1450534 RepID=A0ACD1G064_9EURO|nr:hypothetical protein BO95DRAFT_484639 [Aspergillus brunneoviolaceus CBS 621.78]RAH42621.1 hypothetical protein BO95DRAFT_484639 [Aspergillus brunneoviolaceus CBS 621.78]